jgi:hypothetical protein
MEAIQSMANQSLVNLFVALLGLLAAYATYGISKITTKAKAQTQQIKDDAQRKLLDDAIDDVEELTTKTVGAIEQTTAKELREAVKAGSAKKEDLIALSKKAAEEIAEQIKPEAQQLIEENFGSFEDYLMKCIENKVLFLKSVGV